jgi:hypothetical protein
MAWSRRMRSARRARRLVLAVYWAVVEALRVAQLPVAPVIAFAVQLHLVGRIDREQLRTVLLSLVALQRALGLPATLFLWLIPPPFSQRR